MIEPHTFEWWKLWFAMLPIPQQKALIEMAGVVGFYGPEHGLGLPSTEPRDLHAIYKNLNVDEFLRTIALHCAPPFIFSPGDYEFLTSLCIRCDLMSCTSVEDEDNYFVPSEETQDNNKQQIHETMNARNEIYQMCAEDMTPVDHEDYDEGDGGEIGLTYFEGYENEEEICTESPSAKSSENNKNHIVNARLNNREGWKFTPVVLPWEIDWTLLEWLRSEVGTEIANTKKDESDIELMDDCANPHVPDPNVDPDNIPF